MVDETCLVSKKHRVNTQREELIVVGELDFLLTLFPIKWFVHIE